MPRRKKNRDGNSTSRTPQRAQQQAHVQPQQYTYHQPQQQTYQQTQQQTYRLPQQQAALMPWTNYTPAYPAHSSFLQQFQQAPQPLQQPPPIFPLAPQQFPQGQQNQFDEYPSTQGALFLSGDMLPKKPVSPLDNKRKRKSTRTKVEDEDEVQVENEDGIDGDSYEMDRLSSMAHVSPAQLAEYWGPKIDSIAEGPTKDMLQAVGAVAHDCYKKVLAQKDRQQPTSDVEKAMAIMASTSRQSTRLSSGEISDTLKLTQASMQKAQLATVIHGQQSLSMVEVLSRVAIPKAQRH